MSPWLANTMKPNSPTTSYQIKGNLANQGDPATTSKHQYVLRFVISGEHAVICQKTQPNVACTGHATAQTVSHRHPAAAARVWARVRPCGICGGQRGTEIWFLRALLFTLRIREGTSWTHVVYSRTEDCIRL
jgi:hypothetical protein